MLIPHIKITFNPIKVSTQQEKLLSSFLRHTQINTWEKYTRTGCSSHFVLDIKTAQLQVEKMNEPSLRCTMWTHTHSMHTFYTSECTIGPFPPRAPLLSRWTGLEERERVRESERDRLMKEKHQTRYNWSQRKRLMKTFMKDMCVLYFESKVWNLNVCFISEVWTPQSGGAPLIFKTMIINDEKSGETVMLRSSGLLMGWTGASSLLD